MSLTFVFESVLVSPEVHAQFESDARVIYGAYTGLCSTLNVSVASVQMIFSDDLQHTVRQHTGSTTYEAQREVVQVAAKCLYNNRTPDSQDVSIVVAAGPWQAPAETGSRIIGAFVLAHELMHPLLDQMRSRAGTRTDPNEIAGTIDHVAHSVFDEYWADTLAFLTLKGLNVHVAVPLSDGTTLELQPHTLLADLHVDSLKTTLQQAHSRWPDTVQSYREWQIDIDTMIQRIASALGDCAILMAHAQSHLDAVQDESEHHRCIFDLEPLCHLPAVELYVGSPWRAFWQCLKRGPIGQDADTVKQYHTELVAECNTMMLQIWRALGVDIETRPDGVYYHVGEPLR